MFGSLLHNSIQRRSLVVVLTLGTAALGWISFRNLPIDAVPDITNRQVQVNAEYAGFSPIEMEKQVAYPIERALAGTPGLLSTRSISRSGFAQVTAIFHDDVDIYFARQQVGERLAEVREALPPGAEPSMGPVSTGLGEVLMWTVRYTGSTDDPGLHDPYVTPEGDTLRTTSERVTYLRTVQDWIVQPQLRSVPGVAGIDAIGGYVKQYHVQPDPHRMLAFGITFHQLIEALERNNASIGAGVVEQNGEAYVVRADGRISGISDIERIAIGTREGTPIRISDIASVVHGRELRTGSASENGREVVVGTALMLQGENSRTVAQAAEARLDEVRANLPSGITIETVLDRTKLVEATLHTVTKSLAEGAVLVIAILFLLLGNLRAAMIAAAAIPLSMLFAAIGMQKAGISANLMSLGAIDFGLIVDGAVIVVENCLRHLADERRRLGRALGLSERLHTVEQAAKEMVRPSVFGQAIIITVYLPILALEGIEGKMFRPMAETVILALLAAVVLSLTFVPAMVALLVGGNVKDHDPGWMVRLRAQYSARIGWALRRRRLVVAASAAFFACSLFAFTRLGQEFVPTLDEGDLAVHAMRIPSTALSQSTEMQLEVERTVARFPEVAFVYSKTGTAEVATDPMPPNVSDTFIILKPRKEWPNRRESKADLVRRLEAELIQVPGNNYEFSQPIQMRFNELIAGVRSDVAVKVFGDDFETMRPVAEKIATELRTLKGASDVKVEASEGLPTLEFVIDREAIARHGLSMADVQEVISAAVGGWEVGPVFEGDRRFDMMVRLPEHIRLDLDALRRLPIPIPEAEVGEHPEALAALGEFVASGPSFLPLGELARLDVSEGLSQVSREDGKRRLVVQANVRGVDLGSFVAEAQNRVSGNVIIPPGHWLDWGGQFENLEAAQARLSWLVPLCFVLIFLLLLGALPSPRQALLVFSGVPLALTGGILALLIRGIPFSISAGVGFIALSGIAVLNGLVMISCINELRRNHALEDAISRGSLLRLRPVLMTALVASLGFLPMALATGTGAEVQRPLATVVIGGLISSTLLTLLVLPALYRMFEPKELPQESEG
ncbi:MAG: CusA/CzcA family heavy metal efflux RND transporter [Candidatus Eisenbacteria bacterium]|nr:CusA/CzcA family heavy metal efflux RND transporter [Candidatus Eisenbacteria bacterium]